MSDSAAATAAGPRAADPVHDAIVIGSGMSGLTAAIILAREGLRVLVLEQHYRPGGFLHRFHRKGGLSFDTGFHYFGGVERDQVLGRYLRYLGVYDRLRLLPLDPEGYDDLRFPSQRFVVPAGEARFRERLYAAFPGEREAIDRYLRDLKAICDGFGFYRPERKRSEQDVAHVDRWLSVSLGDYLGALTSHRGLATVLSGQNPLYGVEPRNTPMGLHALTTDSFMQGPYALVGGGDALARAMVERIRELGGRVETRRRVTEILVDGERRVTGVRTHRGEEFRAARVISCAHPKVTVRLLPESVLRPGYRRRILGMRDGVAIFAVYLTTRAALDGYGRKNVYAYRTDDLDDLYDRLDGPQRFAFVTVPTAREGRTPAGLNSVIALGGTTWRTFARWANTRTRERGAEYEAFKQSLGEALVDLACAEVPELKGRIESMEVSTPLTTRDYAASENGAAYGIHHSIDQMGRWGVRPATRVHGLLLTGQSTLMPGILGVTISAFHTCAMILGSEYLMAKVRAAA